MSSPHGNHKVVGPSHSLYKILIPHSPEGNRFSIFDTNCCRQIILLLLLLLFSLPVRTLRRHLISPVQTKINSLFHHIRKRRMREEPKCSRRKSFLWVAWPRMMVSASVFHRYFYLACHPFSSSLRLSASDSSLYHFLSFVSKHIYRHLHLHCYLHPFYCLFSIDVLLLVRMGGKKEEGGGKEGREKGVDYRDHLLLLLYSNINIFLLPILIVIVILSSSSSSCCRDPWRGLTSCPLEAQARLLARWQFNSWQ